MKLRILNYTGRYRIIAQFQVEWRDVWVGVFWRVSEPKAAWPILHIYICFIPCIPLHVTIGRWKM